MCIHTGQAEKFAWPRWESINRTRDLWDTSPMLCQLSYEVKSHKRVTNTHKKSFYIQNSVLNVFGGRLVPSCVLTLLEIPNPFFYFSSYQIKSYPTSWKPHCRIRDLQFNVIFQYPPVSGTKLLHCALCQNMKWNMTWKFSHEFLISTLNNHALSGI